MKHFRFWAMVIALAVLPQIRRQVPDSLKALRRMEWEHHEAHAAAAFFTSPFDQATVITLDGIGDSSSCGTISLGQGESLLRARDRPTESDAVDGDLRQMVNADRRRRFGAAGRTIALVCECGDASCRRAVLLTPDQYDARRPGPVLYPGHITIAH